MLANIGVPVNHQIGGFQRVIFDKIYSPLEVGTIIPSDEGIIRRFSQKIYPDQLM